MRVLCIVSKVAGVATCFGSAAHFLCETREAPLGAHERNSVLTVGFGRRRALASTHAISKRSLGIPTTVGVACLHAACMSSSSAPWKIVIIVENRDQLD